tara:strand:- start:1108 stop:1263 length:156 start_codon:yes stop_codon:yes gene_type:complete
MTILVATMMSCASVRETNRKRFKEITKDICIENHNEAKLAQILYNEIVNGR